MANRQPGNGLVEHPLRILRLGLGMALVSSSVLFLYVAWSSRLLRPGADDYCFAVDVDRGVIGGLAYWFDEISGYSTFLFGAMAFVGWPLRNLPLSLASAIPFILGSLAVGLAGVVALWSVLPQRRPNNLLRSLVWVPAIAVTWWAYLWLPVAQGVDGINRWMANGLTHWQTLNGTYVLQTSWMIIAVLLLKARTESHPRWKWAFLPLGLVLGFGGAALVATITAVCILILLYSWIASACRSYQNQASLLLLLLGTVLGGLASHLSPGTQSRSEVLGTSAPSSITAIGELLNGTIPWSILTWFQSFVHIGSLLVVAIGIASGWMLARANYGFSESRGASLAISLFGIGLIASMASRFTELFAYEGYWHFIAVWLLSFWGLTVGSMSFGSWLSRRSWLHDAPAMLSVLLVALLAVVGALQSMTISMASRSLAWETGPAPLTGMVSDLENPVGMEIECWRELGQLRDLPARGYY